MMKSQCMIQRKQMYFVDQAAHIAHMRLAIQLHTQELLNTFLMLGT